MKNNSENSVSVLRIGHRLVRDDRITTHAALVSRAFGASRIYMTDVDPSVKQTIEDLGSRWGGPEFRVELVTDWRQIARDWKKRQGYSVIHLTMYGVNIDDVIEGIRAKKSVLAIIGAEKVPREVYEIADLNVAVGNQPHSEIAALAIFLDRFFGGMELKRSFEGARLKIIPSASAKMVQETD